MVTEKHKLENNNKYQQGCGEIGILIYSVGENAKWYSCCEKQYGASSKN